LPKDIPLGHLEAEPQRASADGTAPEMPMDRAIETLFSAAASDPQLQLLPWLEREFTLRAMQKTGDNQVRAAKLLGITRATLRKRLERNESVVEEAD